MPWKACVQTRLDADVYMSIDHNVTFSKKGGISAQSRPTSIMYSLPVRRLKEVLGHLVPGSTLVAAEELPSTQLPRLYSLSMSDGHNLILSFAPSMTMRLLRHEATMLSAEAALVSFIAGTDGKLELGGSLPGFTGKPPRSAELLDLVPKLLKHSSSNKEMAYPYSIFEPIAGAPLSTLSIYLSLPERHFIDKQVGSMARRLASLTSPTGLFGPVSRILPDPLTPASTSWEQGSTTWSAAFHSLLEGALRDGEDMAVLLPYEAIRASYQQHSWCLDAVKAPRLVVLDAGSETNVMIKRGPGDGTTMVVNGYPRLTGLRSWGQGVFGDPLISSCFEEASQGFLEGWQEGHEDVIEDTDNAEARLLLYKCFMATVSIVTEYYRPRPDSSRKELEGRRRLTNVLAELDKGDSALKRARSFSTDEESSKKQRAEEI